MASSYTALLGLVLPVQGELQGAWGDAVNNELTSLLDTAIAGTTTLSSDADVTLTTTTGAANQARQQVILWTASGTVTRNITAPAQSKTYVVINATGSTQSIVIRGVGPTTGVTVAAGKAALVAWNGSDFVLIATTDASKLTGTLAVANGGTGATTLTGYVKGSGTSAFTASATIPGADISGNISGNAANVTGTVAVANGGTGATTLTGYVKGSGTSAFTASATIPGSDISGNISGNAANVTGTVAVANGGTGATTLTGYVVGNGTGAFTASATVSGADVSGNISGNAANVTGTVAVANGGTGLTTFAALSIPVANTLNTLSALAAAAGQSVRVNGSGTAWEAYTPSTGTGDVAGPASATDGNLAAFDGTTGKLIKQAATVSVAQGGTGATTFASNNVLLGNGTSALQVVAPGTSGNVLTSNGTTWASAAPSVSVSANNAFSGANTFYNGAGQTFGTATSTQDGIILVGRAGGSASYRVTLIPTTLAANRTLTLPDNSGTVLTSGATVTVAQGGTGVASATAYAVLTGGTTSTGAFQTVSGVGTSGQILTSNGAGALPTWQNAPATGASKGQAIAFSLIFGL